MKLRMLPAIEGINYKSRLGRYWIPITLAKWWLLSLTLVVLRDHPAFQLIVIMLLLFASQALLIVARPFLSQLENYMSLFNDLMTSLYLYTLYTLTDFMGRNEVKEECGMFLLMVVVITITVNIGKVLVQACMMINFKKHWSKLFPNKDRVVQLRPGETEIIESYSKTNITNISTDLQSSVCADQVLRIRAVPCTVAESVNLQMREVKF